MQETLAKIRTNLTCSEITVYWLHFFRQKTHVHSVTVTHGQFRKPNIRTGKACRPYSVKRTFKLNRAFKVIQGHPY